MCYFTGTATIKQVFELRSPLNFNGTFPLVSGYNLIFSADGTWFNNGDAEAVGTGVTCRRIILASKVTLVP